MLPDVRHAVRPDRHGRAGAERERLVLALADHRVSAAWFPVSDPAPRRLWSNRCSQELAANVKSCRGLDCPGPWPAVAPPPSAAAARTAAASRSVRPQLHLTPLGVFMGPVVPGAVERS